MGSGKGISKRISSATVMEKPNTRPTAQEIRDAREKASDDAPINWSYKEQDLLLSSRELNNTYVQTPEQLKECAQALSNASVIGFDIETTGAWPTYGTVRLMQFAIDEPEPRQWVVDCFDVDPKPLLKILKDPNKETVIHYASFEQNWLYYHYGVKIGRIFDTCIAARKISSISTKKTKSRLKDISRRYLGKHVSKTQQTSYWDAQSLNDKQIKYAALDAALLVDLVNPVKKDVINNNAQEEVETALNDIYPKIAAKIDKTAPSYDFEVKRLTNVLENAETIEEVNALQYYSRQVPIFYKQREELNKLVNLKLKELKAK